MILIDTNLLLYAHVRHFAEHPRTVRWLDAQFDNGARIGLPWHSLLGFVRIVSNPAGFRHALTVAEAWRQVRQWLSADNAWIPQPTDRHGDVLEEIFSSVRVTSRFVMDAHLAALAIEHGLTLCSNDRDFARIPKLRWLNPLEESR